MVESIIVIKKAKAKFGDLKYKVMREQATERPFTSKLLYEKRTGKFVCADCGNEIFDSTDKFESGSGWPSFSDAKNVKLKEDYKFFMKRVEVKCKKCDAHLGHVFNDGPKEKGGKRYCINGVALKFKKKD